MKSLANGFEKNLSAFRDVAAPFAFVDLDAFDHNARQLVERAKGKPIRVASKSIRSVFLLKRVLSQPGFQGVLGYSAREAVELAKLGITDILVAYPTVNPHEIREVAKSASITLMVDRSEHLDLLSKIANEESTQIKIALDIDVSSRWPGLHFGVRRSWVSSLPRLQQFLAALKKHPRLTLDGVMGYEAQIAGVQDSNPLISVLKFRSELEIKKRRAEFVREITSHGHSLRFVNGGGTGSIEFTRTDSTVTELAAGSAFFAPLLFDGYRGFQHQPAMGFVLDVTRKPEDEIVTCFSGGYIASGEIGKNKQPQPVWPKGLSLISQEGAGEVQTPLVGEAARALKIGDRVVFRHAKAGEACERFNALHLVQNGKRIQTVPTYRGEGWNFG